jgi:hypothetical protein
MKTIFLLLIILPSLFSCGEDGDSTYESGGTITATINGKSWTSGKVDGVSSAQATSTALVLDIGGFEPSSSSALGVIVFDKKDLVVGKTMDITKFTLSGTSDNEAYGSHIILDKDGNVLKTYYSESGSLKITEMSASNIKGTFSFEAANEDKPSDKISVKNGKFDLPIN